MPPPIPKYLQEQLSFLLISNAFQYELFNNLSGTEDDQIQVGGIDDYTMPSVERKFTLLQDYEESGNESEFKEVDSDYSNDLAESNSQLKSD